MPSAQNGFPLRRNWGGCFSGNFHGSFHQRTNTFPPHPLPSLCLCVAWHASKPPHTLLALARKFLSRREFIYNGSVGKGGVAAPLKFKLRRSPPHTHTFVGGNTNNKQTNQNQWHGLRTNSIPKVKLEFLDYLGVVHKCDQLSLSLLKLCCPWGESL